LYPGLWINNNNGGADPGTDDAATDADTDDAATVEHGGSYRLAHARPVALAHAATDPAAHARCLRARSLAHRAGVRGRGAHGMVLEQQML
jgi:hypothetical protein